jgi:hypothetical protein
MTAGRVELGLPEAAAGIVDGYLEELAARVPVGRRQRARIVAEVADGLACAVDARLESGAPPADAARAATAEFGDPHILATQFARGLGPGLAHRTGAALVLTGPAIGLMWAAVYGAGATQWTGKVAAVLSRVPVFPLFLFVTIPAAIVALTGAGKLARRVPTPPRVATASALTATCAVMFGDITLISTALFTVAAFGGAQPVSVALVVAAIVVSAARAGLAGVASLRLARLRAASS